MHPIATEDLVKEVGADGARLVAGWILEQIPEPDESLTGSTLIERTYERIAARKLAKRLIDVTNRTFDT